MEWFLPGDHPRGCGDKPSSSRIAETYQGSPPRMRGQGGPEGKQGPQGRITPADAGTSAAGAVLGLGAADHPRGCGDKRLPGFRYACCRGSPPRMRGQVGAYFSTRFSSGITPADAGTRRLRHRPHYIPRDHPRGCGDKFVFVCIFRYRSGSPPRMRGQASGLVFRHREPGITPADAGTREIEC